MFVNQEWSNWGIKHRPLIWPPLGKCFLLLVWDQNSCNDRISFYCFTAAQEFIWLKIFPISFNIKKRKKTSCPPPLPYQKIPASTPEYALYFSSSTFAISPQSRDSSVTKHHIESSLKKTLIFDHWRPRNWAMDRGIGIRASISPNSVTCKQALVISASKWTFSSPTGNYKVLSYANQQKVLKGSNS